MCVVYNLRKFNEERKYDKKQNKNKKIKRFINRIEH